MKRFFIFLFGVLMLPLTMMAQPSWTKKAAKSVFTLKTFDIDGNLHASAYGFFVGEHGEAVSSFEPFRGAVSAKVIDAAGKELPVICLLGANETYDVAKFSVDVKKSQPLAVAAFPGAEGEEVWLLPYREQKNPVPGIVRRTEKFSGDYTYYTIAGMSSDETAGAPLLNGQGQVLGLIQQSTAGAADTLTYAVSARYADSLKMTGLSINDPAMRATKVKKALPAQADQALLTLFVAASTMDSASYVQLVNDFIEQYPSEQDGYITRAQLAAGSGRYNDADRDLATALKCGTKKDEVHYSYSRMIYQKVLYQPEQETVDAWTLDRALEEAESAYRINPLPSYLQQQAYVLFAQKKYAEASAVYEQLYPTVLRSPDLFVEASHCKLMQTDTTAYLALLDSAVSLFSRPYLREAAPYILTRAQARMDAGRYRDAVADFNDYEQLMAQQVNDNFYYVRHQAETGGKLYQQALNDIARAIAMNPKQELYYAEKASLEVRVGLYDDAIATAEECIQLVPEYSDGYLFLGLAQCLKGNKAEGVKNLQKAKALGDEQADELIEKYGK